MMKKNRLSLWRRKDDLRIERRQTVVSAGCIPSREVGDRADIPIGALADKVADGKRQGMPGLRVTVILVLPLVRPCHFTGLPDKAFLPFIIHTEQDGGPLPGLCPDHVVKMSLIPAFFPGFLPFAAGIHV